MPGVKDSSLVPLPNRNVIIASFVTAYARLELFNVLHKLQDNVLTIQIGQYLGEMTDELAEKTAVKNGSNNFVQQVQNHMLIVALSTHVKMMTVPKQNNAMKLYMLKFLV